MNKPANIPIRDKEYLKRYQAKLDQIKSVQAKDRYLAYVQGAKLFDELDEILSENQTAYQQQYHRHYTSWAAAKEFVEQTAAEMHPQRLKKAKQLLDEIERLLEPEDYEHNARASAPLAVLKDLLTQAKAEFLSFSAALEDWRAQLKAIMTKVWSEDYAQLKADYQTQKEALSGDRLPRLPLAPEAENLKKFQEQKADDLKALNKKLRFHPRLKKLVQPWEDKFAPKSDFEAFAQNIRMKAMWRKVGAGILLVLFLSLGALGIQYGPNWYKSIQEEKAWESLPEPLSLAACEAFLTRFPDGKYADSLRKARMEIPFDKLSGMESAQGWLFDYEGALQNAIPHGKGKAIYDNGAVYEGDWITGKREGKGSLNLKNGGLYKGSWKNDQQSGDGIFTDSLGQRYEGNWRVDMRSGWGIQHYADSSWYKGGWQANQRSGKGTYQYADGTYYSGYWKSGLYEGTGTYMDTAGIEYHGNWLAGKRHGEGQLMWPNRAKFNGTWEADSLHGYGILIDRYKGNWEGNWIGFPDSLRFFENGILKHRGRWENGVFIYPQTVTD